MSTDSSPAGAPSSKARLSAGDRRARIRTAAARLFSERGFHGVRTRELAEEAGVSEALLFRHFPTKVDLIRSIIDSLGLVERVEALESMAETIPPREGLFLIARQALTVVRDEPGILRLVFFGVLETPELAHDFYQRFLSRLLALETRLFERAQAERTAAERTTARRTTAERTLVERAGSAGGGESSLPGFQPRLLARAFHGSILFYHLSGAILRLEAAPQDPSGMADFLVNLYLPREVNGA